MTRILPLLSLIRKFWLHLCAILILSMLGWTAISSKEEYFKDSLGRYLRSFSDSRFHSSPSKISPMTEVSKKIGTGRHVGDLCRSGVRSMLSYAIVSPLYRKILYKTLEYIQIKELKFTRGVNLLPSLHYTSMFEVTMIDNVTKQYHLRRCHPEARAWH